MYDVAWVTYAAEQFNSLPPSVRRAVMDTIALLQQDPTRYGTYDKRSDQWSAAFSQGVILYLVSDTQVRVVVLRVAAVDV